FGHEKGIMDTTIIVNDWDVNGYCDNPIRIESDSVGTYANIEYFQLNPTYPNWAINNASIRDLKMLDQNGGNPYIANNTVDLGHNDNWDFVGNSGVDYYWIGNQGNWSDFANWSYSSGGPPLTEQCVPRETNTVIFDDNSFNTYNDTVFVDSKNSFGKNVRFIYDKDAWAPTFFSTDPSNILFVYGSLELNESLDFVFAGPIHFDQILGANTGPDYIYSKGRVFLNDLVMQGIGDVIMLDDTLRTLADNENEQYAHIILEHGTFDANDQVMDIAGLHSIYKNERAIDISNSHIYFREDENKVWHLDATNFELNAENSTLFIESLEGVILTEYGSEPLVYNDIVMNKSGDSVANIYNTTIYNNITANGPENFVTSQYETDKGKGEGTFVANNVYFNNRGSRLDGTSVTDTVIFADTNGVIIYNHQINYAQFSAPGEIVSHSGETNKFARCDFYSSGTFRGENEFDTLHLFAGIVVEATGNSGNVYDFQSGSEQIIYDSLFLRGNQCARISLNSIQGSAPAFIRKDEGEFDVQCDFLVINNVGTKSTNIDFYAGSYSLKPNPQPEGWIFANTEDYIYGFQGQDVYFCEGDQITLNAEAFNGDPFTEYYWNYSMYPEGPKYTVNSTEPVHILVKYFEGCYVEDDIYPKYDQAPQVVVEPGPFCDGDPIHLTISPSDHDYSYEWFNQETTPTIVSDLSYTGPVWVNVKDLSGPAGCSGKGEQTIQVNPYPDPQSSLGQDIWLKFGEEVTLNAGEGDEFEWTSDPETNIEPNNQQEITVPGTVEAVEYTVNVGLEGCYKEGLITVNMYPYSSLGVPTAFSPNGDGANDFLSAYGSGFKEVDFRIYNRFGEEVFETSEWVIETDDKGTYFRTVGWDGTYKGQKQDMDVFTYYLKVVYQDAGVAEEKGNITLIR
ncbi:MAG: gliding motility-associated C-terminal domain-containing protein, partial [Bacteroidales bacterium]